MHPQGLEENSPSPALLSKQPGGSFNHAHRPLQQPRPDQRCNAFILKHGNVVRVHRSIAGAGIVHRLLVIVVSNNLDLVITPEETSYSKLDGMQGHGTPIDVVRPSFT